MTAKVKDIPVIGRGSLYSCEMSRLPHSWFTDDIEGVSLTRGNPLPPGRYLVLVSVRRWVDPRAIVQLVELGQLKNLVTSSEIEPATFWPVALCVNELRYRVPHLQYKEAFRFRCEVSLRNWAEEGKRLDTRSGYYFTPPCIYVQSLLPSSKFVYIVAWFVTGLKTTPN
jgi:hypothetical protein